MGRWRMRFPKTIRAADESSFAASFERELRAQLALFPLREACEARGTPDWSSMEIANLSRETRDAQLLVRCTVYFTELSRGGCADSIIREERALAIELFIDKKTGAAYLNDG